MSGTSFSAPSVARTIAAILAIHPAFQASEIVQILKDSTKQSPELADKLKWGGISDEPEALELARKRPP